MIVVSDSSPLIALRATDYLYLLREMYGRVLIPDAVHREVTDAGASQPGASAVRKAAWIEVATVEDQVELRSLRLELDVGEAEALALALERNAKLLLVDERVARRKAEALGVPYIGVVGVLLLAHKRGLLPAVRTPLDALRDAGFWLGDRVYNEALEAAGEAFP